MLSRQFDAFMGCDAEYKEAKVVLFGAPFDSTTSFRPGARFAARTIRGDSFGVETYSPYQDADLTDCELFDCGDLELPFGNSEKALRVIEAQTAQIIKDGKKPLMIGGEHLVTLGAVRAAVKAHQGLHIIHFDAHADLRDDYLGEKLSHATVMRRAWELLGDQKIHQFGIRSGERQEFQFAVQHTDMNRYHVSAVPSCLAALKGKPIYLTIDLDVRDPSVFPGTGTPEPGGVSFNELLNAVLPLRELDIVGCDVVELSPPYDPSGISTAAACKLIRELFLMMA